MIKTEGMEKEKSGFKSSHTLAGVDEAKPFFLSIVRGVLCSSIGPGLALRTDRKNFDKIINGLKLHS